jgi:AraC-like DNA-binding protein
MFERHLSRLISRDVSVYTSATLQDVRLAPSRRRADHGDGPIMG